jgi:hypothetical protein
MKLLPGDGTVHIYIQVASPFLPIAAVLFLANALLVLFQYLVPSAPPPIFR